MKAYFVESNNVEDLQNALGLMVEYAMFMAEESGSYDRTSYINEVLSDNNIEIRIETV